MLAREGIHLLAGNLTWYIEDAFSVYLLLQINIHGEGKQSGEWQGETWLYQMVSSLVKMQQLLSS